MFWCIWVWCRKKSKILSGVSELLALLKLVAIGLKESLVIEIKFFTEFQTFFKGLTVLMAFFSEKVSWEKWDILTKMKA